MGINVAAGGTSTIRANDITNNGTGVRFQNGATSTEFFCNNITGSTMAGAENQGTTKIVAEGNWWGTAAGPGGTNGVSGLFDVDPVALGQQDTQCDTTVAVTLGYFNATRDGETVHFIWQTATETGTAGFNLYGEVAEERVSLNNDMMPSAAVDSVEPLTYYASAATGAMRFYLEEISTDGTVELHGPFELGEVYGAYQLPANLQLDPAGFLPLISRE